MEDEQEGISRTFPRLGMAVRYCPDGRDRHAQGERSVQGALPSPWDPRVPLWGCSCWFCAWAR